MKKKNNGLIQNMVANMDLLKERKILSNILDIYGDQTFTIYPHGLRIPTKYRRKKTNGQ